MSAVNFYLKKPEPGTARRLIYLQFKFKGQKIVYSFGEKIDPANWNAKKQRVKSNKATTADGQHSLNDLLDNLVMVCNKAYNDELKNGYPTRGKLKEHLDNFFYQNIEDPGKEEPTLYKLIQRFIDGEIKSKGKDKSEGSLNNYRSVLIHLQEFQKKCHYKVDFDTINLDFFYQYVSFLKKLRPKNVPKDSTAVGLSQNTIAKDIALIKVFMGEAVDLRYTDNLTFKHKKFSVSSKETEAVYLTEKEIISLYNHDFSDKLKLEQVRDLFVVGCFTGLRYSDYSNINPENIVERDGEFYIKMITQKTGELVIIPCNPVVLNIFDKYAGNRNKLPRSISNQKFNDYIKEVCKEAGLVENGRLSSDPKKKLYECISSHTARRSFATNLYLEGFPTIDLMKITGHKTESSFLKYIKVSKEENAKRLSDHIKKNWSSKILKAAS